MGRKPKIDESLFKVLTSHLVLALSDWEIKGKRNNVLRNILKELRASGSVVITKSAKSKMHDKRYNVLVKFSITDDLPNVNDNL